MNYQKKCEPELINISHVKSETQIQDQIQIIAISNPTPKYITTNTPDAINNVQKIQTKAFPKTYYILLLLVLI